MVVMFDGFGPGYLAESKMPVLKTMLGYWRLLARRRLGWGRAAA